MTTAIAWKTSASASGLYAAGLLAAGQPLVDNQLDAALRGPADDLARGLATAGLVAAEFWSHYLPLSLEAQPIRQRVRVALTKAFGPECDNRLGSELANQVGAIEQAMATAIPRLDEELELRLGPWRQLWEARGPGVLHGIRRLAENQIVPESAAVALIRPARGGGGEAFPSYNSVLFEAVLTDPQAALPEIVRLSWLLAQLNLDLPRYTERLPRDRLRHAAALGLAPLVLRAAEDAELVKADAATLRLALEQWELTHDGVADLADLLQHWYGVYVDSRPEFGAALVALDEMLGDRA